MGRLSDILAKASNAQAGLETAVEADVNKYVDRVEQIHKKREDVFLKKHSELDGTVTDLAQFETELDAFGKNDHSGAGANGNAYVGVNGKT
jgi:hypothetical protein